MLEALESLDFWSGRARWVVGCDVGVAVAIFCSCFGGLLLASYCFVD